MTTKQVTHREETVGRRASPTARQDGGPIVTWIREHPVGAYLVWFFTVGWAISFIPVVARSAFAIDLPFSAIQVFIIATTLLGMFLPAVVITRVVDGPEGVRELLRSLVKVRASLGWYAVALLALPVPAVVLALILYGAPDATAATLLAAIVSGLLLQTAIGFVTNNLWEEVAVMGFLQARLQARHGALLAAVITAPLFALQHLSLQVANGIGPALVLSLLLGSAIFVPYRAVMAWVYNRTGSLFLVGLLHAAGNGAAVGSGFGDPLLRHLYENQSVGSLHLLAAVLVGLAVIAATRARLGVRARPARGPRTEIAPAA